MPSTAPILRDYNMDDLEMFERAQIFHDNFVIDMADFTAAFPALDAVFAADFQTAIDDADAIPSDDEVVGQIEIITEQLDDKMAECREALQKLYAYVKITFKSEAKLNSFGKSLYKKARNSQTKMKELLELGHRTASEPENETALLATGYAAGDITQLETLMNELDALNASQEILKMNRLNKTESRVMAYNAVWSYMMDINQASKVVYASSPAKLSEYLLYPAEHHGLSKPQNLTAEYIGGSPAVIHLGWDAVDGAESYDVYYDTADIGAPSGDYNLLDTFTDNFADVVPVDGKRNYFKVKAKNDEHTSAYSDEAFVDVEAA